MDNIKEPDGFNSKFINKKITNTKSDLIEITHDKLENILLKYLKNIDRVKSWFTPLTLLITVLIVLLTANFKDFMQIKKELWNAMFILTFVTSCIWFLYSCFISIKCAKKSSIQYLMRKIKNSENN